MKHIKLYEASEFDPFEEENWDDENENIPIDYISVYISYKSLIITENQIKNKDEFYTYLDSVAEKDIPYDNKIILDDKGKFKKEIKIDDPDCTEWLIKINNREDITQYKGFIENSITKNIEKYFNKKGWKFELNGGFHIYPLDIEIPKNQFNNFINKYFFEI